MLKTYNKKYELFCWFCKTKIQFEEQDIKTNYSTGHNYIKCPICNTINNHLINCTWKEIE